MNSGGLVALGPYGMWLAHGSRQSEWPASGGIMNFGSLGFNPYEMWMANSSRCPEQPAIAEIMKFGRLVVDPCPT